LALQAFCDKMVAPEVDKMQIQRIEVRETNCYLLHGDRGIVLIDPGPPGGARTVISAVSRAGVQQDDIRLILVTHGHLDHYGAAAEVKTWCGAPIAAHPEASEFSRDRRNALPPAQTLRASLVRWVYLLLAPLATFTPLQADLGLEGSADLATYGVDARTLLLPGHSPASLGVATTNGDVFVGDLFVNYAVPSQPLYLSDTEAWQRSYARIRELQPSHVYVGHGEPFPGDRLDTIHPARYQLRWWVR
jgi:glyoxylase-like metal-dependent hydrolase (beta-lactamase superfamily II)